MSGRAEVVVLGVAELEDIVSRAVELGVRRALQDQPQRTSEWMTPEAVADMLGYKRSYIPELVRCHRLPCHKCGRRMRFHRSEVQAWAENRGRQ